MTQPGAGRHGLAALGARAKTISNYIILNLGGRHWKTPLLD
jgi:hypothetical protein